MKYFTILLLILTGCSSQNIIHGIPNFAVVSPGIYRGGQPTKEGWQYLKDLGVEIDCKLNTWDEASDIEASDIGIFIQDDGIIDLSGQLFHINTYNLDCAVQTLIDKPNYHGSIFVHCEHGQDRTGLVIACYRIRVNRWSKSDAEKEMLEHGFHKSLYGLWKAWQDFE